MKPASIIIKHCLLGSLVLISHVSSKGKPKDEHNNDMLAANLVNLIGHHGGGRHQSVKELYEELTGPEQRLQDY